MLDRGQAVYKISHGNKMQNIIYSIVLNLILVLTVFTISCYRAMCLKNIHDCHSVAKIKLAQYQLVNTVDNNSTYVVESKNIMIFNIIRFKLCI